MELKHRDKSTLQSNVALTFPKISNYKACQDYFLSKLMTHRKKVPSEDNINRNVSIEHHFAMKKLVDSEQRLKHRRELADKQRLNLEEQWKDLMEKEDHFRENFIYFSKFVHENIEKRERALQKIDKMKEIREERVQKIHEMAGECYHMQELKKTMDKCIAKMNIYENFLSKVVDSVPNEFNDVVDILMRYEALMDAQAELLRMQEMDMQRLEKFKTNFDELVADKYVKIACLKTELSDIEARYEAAHSNCQKWENIHHIVILETQKKLSEIEAVKDSCWQIYKDICDRKGLPTIYKNNYPKQFEIIKKDLLQCKLVNEKIVSIENEKLRLSEKACPSNGTS